MLAEEEVLSFIEDQEKVLILLQDIGGNREELLQRYDVVDTFGIIRDEPVPVLPDEDHVGGDSIFPVPGMCR